METYETDATLKALDLTEKALERSDVAPALDTTVIDADTYAEYDFTPAEMLHWVMTRQSLGACATYMIIYKGKYAYTEKGPAVTEADMKGLEFHDTYQGAIQAEILKEREVSDDRKKTKSV